MTISGSHKANFPLPNSANELFEGGGLGMAVLDCHRSSDSLDKIGRDQTVILRPSLIQPRRPVCH